MERNELQQNLHLTIRELASHFDKSATSIRYWLKKYDLSLGRPRGVRPTYQNIVKDGSKTCTKCGQWKLLSDYYKNSRKGSLHSACKDCLNTVTVERQRKFKSLCVEYKGGNCQVCGYDRYQGSFDFHHLDPSQKDFSIATVRSLSFDDVIKAELDKCALLCSNCHREVHGGVLVL